MGDTTPVSSDKLFRHAVMKHSNDRSYDDIVIIKAKIEKMNLLNMAFSGLHPHQVKFVSFLLTSAS